MSDIEVSLDMIRRIGVDKFVSALPDDEVEGFVLKLRQLEDAEKYGKFSSLFPDSGPLRRELYTKHMEFFKAGAKYRERCFMAGNRVGKTVAGSFETTCHVTGDYPDWWE